MESTFIIQLHNPISEILLIEPLEMIKDLKPTELKKMNNPNRSDCLTSHSRHVATKSLFYNGTEL